jgi:branched-chain amino acid transport system ATP-binding protein
MSASLLVAEGISKRFGGLKANENVSLDVREGEIHAVIGPNGAGKTTLMAQLSGEQEPDSGRILFQGQDVTALPIHGRAKLGIVRCYQISSTFLDLTVLENVLLGVQAREGGHLRWWANARRDPGLLPQAQEAIAAVQLEERTGVLVRELSHGERRQLELAMVLATRPRLFLLDEPLAGMGMEESPRIVELILGLKRRGGILLIEHDMDAVFKLADRITVLVEGRVLVTGSPEQIRGDARVRDAYLADEDAPDVSTAPHA